MSKFRRTFDEHNGQVWLATLVAGAILFLFANFSSKDKAIEDRSDWKAQMREQKEDLNLALQDVAERAKRDKEAIAREMDLREKAMLLFVTGKNDTTNAKVDATQATLDRVLGKIIRLDKKMDDYILARPRVKAGADIDLRAFGGS